MTLVFITLSSSVDGFVSGHGARAGLGLGDGFRISTGCPITVRPAGHFSLCRQPHRGSRTGAVVSGRNTYEHADRSGGGSMVPGTPLFVVSRDPGTRRRSGTDDRHRRARIGDPTGREVAEPSGKDVKLASGATATEALRLGLLDEIVINQVPVLLGGGHPYFHELPHAIELERTSVAVNEGVTHLTFRVVKSA